MLLHRCPHYFAKIELFKFAPLGLMIKSLNAQLLEPHECIITGRL
ncbi:MAG TPA: hypothetical protein PLZ01_03210 [bacterium]|nr:hypothetical protein [bacterium]